jgi:hypothetical protein
MTLSKILTAAAAVSLVAAPVAAQAADASHRTSSAQKGEDIAGVSPIILVIAAAVVVATALIIADDDNNKNPVSP